jgi:PRTRC genetic system ThiF family protein
MLTHTLHEALHSPRSPLKVLVVGAGGNGSKLTVGMKNLHGALLALGHPGIQLTLADGDTVSTSNLVRQSFYPSDVGLNKATVLINRINTSCGLAWEAMPRHLSADDRSMTNTRIDLLASCVDSRAARREVASGLKRSQRVIYHLDLGNLRDCGQLVLGAALGYYNRRAKDRLRTAFELFPELTDTTLPEDDTPSCSTMEALEKQDLFINDTLVTSALALLWRLLGHGEIAHHGAFVDLKTGSVRPLPVDPALWRRLRRQRY